MNRELSSLLLTKAWLINERVGTILYHNFLTGKLNLVDAKAASEKKVADRYAGMPSASVGTFVYSTRKVKHKSGKYVAIMPVIGTLTKRGDMCSYGMRDYINEIAALNENEDIVAIVMDMEGPGGTVDGTNEFGLAVRNSKKPIVTFGDYMVASANYWVASQSDYIIGNKNNPTEFGSIGVLCVHEYWGKYIEENIGEIKIIRAPQSVDKARVNPIEELTPELEKEIQEDLRGLAKDFFGAVKKGRGDKLKTDEKVWGTGRMFKLQESIDNGLIDAPGTLMDAINKAAELATPHSGSGAAAAIIKTTAIKTSNTKMKKNIFSSFFQSKKKAAKKAAEPTAEETDSTPAWTEDMIFNTDGSGDGAFCIHPDTAGTDRKFETKIDNNQGNEPPTDPAVTEDDNWSQVAEEEDAPVEEENEETETEGAQSSTQLAGQIKKLNAALKKSNKELATLKAEKAKNENKKAGPVTTVVSSNDRVAGAGKKATTSWEKKAAAKFGNKEE